MTPTAQELWRPILPVPDGVQLEIPAHRLGQPSACWRYLDNQDRLLYCTARFEKPEGGKEVLPLSYCEGPSGQRQWRWQAPPEPRALLGLDQLAARPEAPVIVVEGEKKVSAAAELFPDFIVVSSQGGAGAVKKSNWTALRGRKVTIWPDHDEAGERYATDVAQLAYEAGAIEVRIVEVPRDFPPKWDLADPVPASSIIDDLRRFLDAARFLEAVATGPGVEIVNGVSMVPRPIIWLWPGWLAEGKLHILAGAPGTGKTTIAIDFSAAITAGRSFPDGTPAPIGDVLVWSGEDDPADSWLPRLIASGGDKRRFYYINGTREGGVRRPFDPSHDVPMLIERARPLQGLRLLILDPIVSAIAGDSHKNAEVRRGLQPLVECGQELGCAVLGITHFSKGTTGREPTERVTGSLAFGALPRLVMATAKAVELDGKRRLIRAKSNIGPDGGGFEFELTQEPLPGLDFTAQRVTWGQTLEGNAWELLKEAEQVEEGPASAARAIAEQFLEATLADGAVSVEELIQAAKTEGIAKRTLERAKQALGIKAKRGGANWSWYLPGTRQAPDASTKAAKPSEDRQHNSMAALAALQDRQDRQPDAVAVFEIPGGLAATEWEEEL